MLVEEENEILSRVGPGTLMGNLLRRYWTPACLSAELEADGSPLEVRLLGENLVAFRDTNGRAALSIPSYPTHESGGIVWTYMGPPETMTPFRDFGTETLGEGESLVWKIFWDCNWLQALEGNIDTAHISHLHQYFGAKDIADDGSDKPGYPSTAWAWKEWWFDRAPRIEISDEWFGFRAAGIRRTPNGHRYVRVEAFTMPYGTIVSKVPYDTLQIFVVPIDDHTNWRYAFQTQGPPPTNGGPWPELPYARVGRQEGLLSRDYRADNHYQVDREFQKVSFSGIRDFMSQDMAVTESMGPIYDRRKEHLGAIDLPVVHLRQMLVSAAKALAEGKEPPALAGQGDFRTIRSAEKILSDEEDWRLLGTDDDPAVQEAMRALTVNILQMAGKKQDKEGETS